MQKDELWNADLENCFTNCVIQKIKCLEKSEVQIFCLNATIPSGTAGSFYLLPHQADPLC